MESMHPAVISQLCLLVPPPTIQVMSYLYKIMEPGGRLPKSQAAMAQDLGIAKQTMSNRLAPLRELNVVLRTDSEKRGGNSYYVHPLAAKYESFEAMEAAIAKALHEMKAGRLARLRVPMYDAAPPRPEGGPVLRVAS
ncbi:hypothetical protein AB0I82_35850 [Streptomyces sp. NPDC050315]|uniref:hypothetical protein n=1 Tax=Streptomyces sp. NPDC050315 TaxID=3155039 RepID=UPI0034266773